MSQELDTHLVLQVKTVIRILEDINNKRVHQRLKYAEELDFVEATITRFLKTRQTRAEDLLGERFSHALQLANSILLYPVYRVLCVDGRVWPPLLGGLITGGSVRVPAGQIPDFIQDAEEDKLFLPDDSYFADLLRNAFAENDTIVEILDAHRGCAAAKEKAILRTGNPQDGGLLLNVQRQMGIKAAIEEWVEKFNVEHGTHKRAVVIHISSNPSDERGGFIMGLRKESCIERARMSGGFTPQVLKDLLDSGEIISTDVLANREPFAAHLQTVMHEFALPTINWGEQYAESALLFWQALDSFFKKSDVLQSARDILIKVFPYLEKDKLKLDIHAKILLAGMLAGFVHSQREYTVHRERVCVVTRHAERGPFSKRDDMDSFTIFALDRDRHSHVQLVLGLMRSIRQTLSYPLRSDGVLTEVERQWYVSAPGVFVVQEVVRGDVDWEELKNVDWSDLDAVDWLRMSTGSFLQYLNTKKISLPFALAIEDLRTILVRLYDPTHVTSRLIMNGDIVVFAELAGKFRKPGAIIPFVLRGYRQK